jgi:hypothetical protein
MPYAFLLKILVSALLIAAVSELGKRNTFAAAFLAALPVTSLMAMLWLYHDTGDSQRVAALAASIFWLVLPSLAFFAAFPLAVRHQVGFWAALALAIAAAALAYGGLWALTRSIGWKVY